MRAQKAYRDFGIGRVERPQIRRSNIVVAEPLVADEEIAKEFVAKLGDPELGRVFMRLVESLSLAGDMGLLLCIEQLVARQPEYGQTGDLFAPPEDWILPVQLSKMARRGAVETGAPGGVCRSRLRGPRQRDGGDGRLLSGEGRAGSTPAASRHRRAYAGPWRYPRLGPGTGLGFAAMIVFDTHRRPHLASPAQAPDTGQECRVGCRESHRGSVAPRVGQAQRTHPCQRVEPLRLFHPTRCPLRNEAQQAGHSG